MTGSGYLFFYNEISLSVIQDVTKDVLFSIVFILTQKIIMLTSVWTALIIINDHSCYSIV